MSDEGVGMPLPTLAHSMMIDPAEGGSLGVRVHAQDCPVYVTHGQPPVNVNVPSTRRSMGAGVMEMAASGPESGKLIVTRWAPLLMETISGSDVTEGTKVSVAALNVTPEEAEAGTTVGVRVTELAVGVAVETAIWMLPG